MFSRPALDANERVVLDLRPHWRLLIIPILLVPVVAGLAAYAVAAVPAGWYRTPVRWAVLVIAVLVLFWWSLRPYLRWVSTRLMVTSRRALLRYGVLTRSGRDILLSRVSDVSFHRTLFDQLFRCGTLEIESTGDEACLFPGAPNVERVVHDIMALLDQHPYQAQGGR